jgi:hypothetical protein
MVQRISRSTDSLQTWLTVLLAILEMTFFSLDPPFSLGAFLGGSASGPGIVE